MSTVMRKQQPSGSYPTELRPFRVEISDSAIDDLRGRLARTRWPEKEPVGDWSMGIPLAYVQELAGYWEKSYDMQRVADRLNRYEQFMTTIDGVAGQEPAPVPPAGREPGQPRRQGISRRR